MVPTTKTILGWMAILVVPVAVRAYPADSLLLVQITNLSATLAAPFDTGTVQKFEYSRDNQDNWYERQFEYRHDSLQLTTLKTYDASGRVLAESTASQGIHGGSVHTATRFEYDAQGKMSRETISEGDSLTEIGLFQYDDSGKLQKWIITSDPPGISVNYLYAYDSQGRLISQKHMNGDSLVEAYHDAYDGNGNLVSRILVDAKGDTSSVTTSEYDGSGRQTREVSTYGKDSILNTDKRTEYDAAGNVKKVSWYGKSGLLQSYDDYVYQTLPVPLSIFAFRGRKGGSSGMAPDRWVLDALGRRLSARAYAGYMMFNATPARLGSP